VKAARQRLAAALVTGAFLPLCIPAMTGCTAAAYGLGVATMVNDLNVRQREEYESYRREAEAENAPRIMTFRQWVRSQPSG
jgi:hypothetical protein